ncbi:hypothetical protein FWH13_00710 [Candidatus Saccharibacteria bacterium]|nr:hypothetical protein [Candidatus Saccharibacteria bacterium]
MEKLDEQIPGLGERPEVPEALTGAVPEKEKPIIPLTPTTEVKVGDVVLGPDGLPIEVVSTEEAAEYNKVKPRSKVGFLLGAIVVFAVVAFVMMRMLGS